MTWFLKYYRHDECDVDWTDEWSCGCNDRCPVCDAEIEPYDWDDLTVVVSRGSGDQWVVSVSPPDAEDKPNYSESYFERKEQADDFAGRERERLGRT
jgi:hypothetical protein